MRSQVLETGSELHLFGVSSHPFHGLSSSTFRNCLLDQSLRLVLRNFEPRLRVFLDDPGLDVRLDVALLFKSFSFLQDLSFEGIGPSFGQSFDVFSLDKLARLFLQSFNLLQSLLRFLLNLSLEQVDLFHVLVMLIGHQRLHVISL